MKEVLDFLSANRPFYLATYNGSQPRLRPMGFVMEFEGKIYFAAGTQKEVWRQLLDHPKAEIATTASDNKWLRLSGTAVEDKNPALFGAAVAVMPQLKEMYPNGSNLGLFYLKDATALLYDISGEILKTTKL